MRDFFHYFFGAGDEIEFKYFSLAHILPIVLAVIIIYLIFRYRDRLRISKWDDKIRLILSFALIITEMSYFWRLVGVPDLKPDPTDHLPITVCGWAVIFSAYFLLTKNQTLFDITYFWLFSGTLFALATPTVIAYCGPTRFRYYQFWCEHLLGYIALFYNKTVLKHRVDTDNRHVCFSTFKFAHFNIQSGFCSCFKERGC